MAAETEGLRFQFETGLEADDDGAVKCDLCGRSFPYPGVETMLRGYVLCPVCATSPELAAAYAKQTANDKKKLASRYDNPRDRRDVRGEYLALAESLRGLKSYDGIPGGITAGYLASASNHLRGLRDNKGTGV